MSGKRFVQKLTALIMPILCLGVCLCGCSLQSSERVKLRELEFTVLSEELIPKELKSMIEERKDEQLRLTYSDKENTYIVAGYGQQETGGYSIVVDELYLSDRAVYVSTLLLGPEISEKQKKEPSWPYIVIKTELLEETVIFE